MSVWRALVNNTLGFHSKRSTFQPKYKSKVILQQTIEFILATNLYNELTRGYIYISSETQSLDPNLSGVATWELAALGNSCKDIRNPVFLCSDVAQSLWCTYNDFAGKCRVRNRACPLEQQDHLQELQVNHKSFKSHTIFLQSYHFSLPTCCQVLQVLANTCKWNVEESPRTFDQQCNTFCQRVLQGITVLELFAV